jgi:1,4-dihydroxy-2-naphthoyl-CoA hydrolase
MADTRTDPSAFADMMPFALAAGIEITSAGPDEVDGRLEWAPERCTTAGVLHGGVLMTLADTVGAVCAFFNLPEGATTATIESKTNFLRGLRTGTLHAEARPLHVGRSVIVVQTELTDDDGGHVAHVVQTQAVIRPSAQA